MPRCRVDGYVHDMPVAGICAPPGEGESAGEDLSPTGHLLSPLRIAGPYTSIGGGGGATHRVQRCRLRAMVLVLTILAWSGLCLTWWLSPCVFAAFKAPNGSLAVQGKCAAAVGTPLLVGAIAYVLLIGYAFTARDGVRVLRRKLGRLHMADQIMGIRECEPKLVLRVRCGHDSEAEAGCASVILALNKAVNTFQAVHHVPVQRCFDVAAQQDDRRHLSARQGVVDMVHQFPKGPVLLSHRLQLVYGDVHSATLLPRLQRQMFAAHERKDVNCSVDLELFLPRSGYVPETLFLPAYEGGWQAIMYVLDALLFSPAAGIVTAFLGVSWIYWQLVDRRAAGVTIYHYKVFYLPGGDSATQVHDPPPPSVDNPLRHLLQFRGASNGLQPRAPSSASLRVARRPAEARADGDSTAPEAVKVVGDVTGDELEDPR